MQLQDPVNMFNALACDICQFILVLLEQLPNHHHHLLCISGSKAHKTTHKHIQKNKLLHTKKLQKKKTSRSKLKNTVLSH